VIPSLCPFVGAPSPRIQNSARLAVEFFFIIYLVLVYKPEGPLLVFFRFRFYHVLFGFSAHFSSRNLFFVYISIH